MLRVKYQIQEMTLNEVNPLSGDVVNVFTALQNSALAIPWRALDIADDLDLYYYGNHSGGKIISPIVEKMLSDGRLTANGVSRLASVAFNLFGQNWGRLWAVKTAEYNPIENYDLTEEGTDNETTSYGRTDTRTDNLTHTKTGTDTETPNITDTRTANLTHAKTGTETDTPNLTETRTPNITKTAESTDTETPNTTETQTPALSKVTQRNVYGFDTDVSGTGTPAEYTDEQNTGTNTLTRTGENTINKESEEHETGTETNTKTGTNEREYDLNERETGTDATQRTGTNTTQYNTTDRDTGTQQNAQGGEDEVERAHSLSRHGNIGVTTTQQMLQSEIELWQWDFFTSVVFPDIDRVLTIPTY